MGLVSLLSLVCQRLPASFERGDRRESIDERREKREDRRERERGWTREETRDKRQERREMRDEKRHENGDGKTREPRNDGGRKGKIE